MVEWVCICCKLGGAGFFPFQTANHAILPPTARCPTHPSHDPDLQSHVMYVIFQFPTPPPGPVKDQIPGCTVTNTGKGREVHGNQRE